MPRRTPTACSTWASSRTMSVEGSCVFASGTSGAFSSLIFWGPRSKRSEASIRMGYSSKEPLQLAGRQRLEGVGLAGLDLLAAVRAERAVLDLVGQREEGV